MLRLRRPTASTLDRRVARSQGSPFSVRPSVLGATARNEVPEDYSKGEWEIALGRGAETFEAACAALRRWDQFPIELVGIHPKNAPLVAGTVVALSAHAGGFHADLACRIVEVIEESSTELRRFGFSYATIEGHVERGEELFLIEHDLTSDSVTYRVRAVSGPAHPVAWIVQPWIRSVQVDFGRRSAAALRKAMGSPHDLPAPLELKRRPPVGLPWLGAFIWGLSLALESQDDGVLASADGSPRMLLVTFAALVALPAARPLLPRGWLRSRAAAAMWAISASSLALWGPLARQMGIEEATGVGEGLWLAVTLIVGVRAGLALLGRRAECAEFGGLVGLLMLPVGAAWAAMVRVGWWPGGFPPAIAELTALHFHYAGAIFPIVLGCAVRSWRVSAVPLVSIAYLVGVSGVGLGISFSPNLEGLSAIALIGLVTAVGALQLRAAILGRSKLGQMLLGIGSLSLFLGMGLAATYALSEWIGSGRGDEPYTGGGVISWTQMVPWHGVTMAIGFALCSVLGWIATRETTDFSAPIGTQAERE